MKIQLTPALCLSPRLPAQDDPNRPAATTPALDPAGTAARMTLPPGFRMQVIASEPDIVQPIAYTIDDRGRLWVLENTNYPDSPGVPKDRVIVLEYAGGDGSFEKRSLHRQGYLQQRHRRRRRRRRRRRLARLAAESVICHSLTVAERHYGCGMGDPAPWCGVTGRKSPRQSRPASTILASNGQQLRRKHHEKDDFHDSLGSSIGGDCSWTGGEPGP